VVYVPAPPVNLAPKPRNVLIEWAAPEVIIREQVENLGVREVSEEEYAQLVLEAKAKGQAVITTTPLKKPVPILYGDLEYLKLVDLKCHGLGEYEEQVKKRELQVVNSNASIASVSVPVHASSDLTNQESHRHLNIEQIGSNFIL
jgi:predicted RNA-binding protein with PUA domain